MAGAKKLASPRGFAPNNGKGDDFEDEDDASARERDLVETYVADHALEETLNDVVNQVVGDRPEDPFLVLSSLLYGKATAKRGIFHVECKEILDASGLPGALVRVHTGKGVFEASCSSHAAGLPDRPESFDEFAPTIPMDKQRFGGKGYRRRAEQAQNVLVEKLVDFEPTDQLAVDAALLLAEADVGHNFALAASVAVCRAGARYAELPLHEYIASLLELPLENSCLPMPQFSVINAGALASNKLFVREVFVAPVSATSFSDALQLGAEFSRAVRHQLEERGIGFSNLGAFGGFAPQLQSIAETFQVLRGALDELRSRIDGGGGPTSLLLDSASVTPLRLEFGIDFAASEFVTPPPPSSSTGGFPGDEDADAAEEARAVFTYDTDKWVPGSDGVIKSSEEMLEMIQSCVKELDVAAVVDPFDRGDIKAFAALLSGEHDPPTGAEDGAGLAGRLLGGDPNCRLQVVARDLVDAHGLEAIQEERAANTVLLQPDQFATVSRLLASITEARRYGLAVMLGASVAQCGGSDAAFLAALAIGAGVGQVKFGGLAASECVDRYNQLLLAADGPVPPVFVAGEYRR